MFLLPFNINKLAWGKIYGDLLKGVERKKNLRKKNAHRSEEEEERRIEREREE